MIDQLGLGGEKGYTSPLKTHHHDKHRGEVQRGSIRLYHASCRQSCSAETSYFEKHLSRFFPGAKIGVLGLNGAGKSTLLRIMAGIDKDIEGEARHETSRLVTCRRNRVEPGTHRA